MASPITSAMDQISADWASLVPSERSTVRYAELTGREAQAGVTGDRRFAWGPPQRLEVSAMTGDSEITTWAIVAVLRISSAGKGRSASVDAACEEMTLLDYKVRNRADWPIGVIDVQGTEVSLEIEPVSGDALVTLAYRVLALERYDLTYADPVEAIPSVLQSNTYTFGTYVPARSFIGAAPQLLGSLSISGGDLITEAIAWCDTESGPASTVTLSIVKYGGASCLDLETDSTEMTTLSGTAVNPGAGLYQIMISTDDSAGVARVSKVMITNATTFDMTPHESQAWAIDPDPSRIIGDSEVIIGRIDLTEAGYSVSATAWNDTSEAGPATVYVRVRSPLGVEVASMSTVSTSPSVLSDTFTVMIDPGIHTITAETSTSSGVGVVELVIVTREVD